MHHLIKRQRNQSAQADDISFALPCRLQNFCRRHHDPEIDDLVVITLQDNADDVLANVVHVTFHRRHDDARLRLRVCVLLRFHERQEIRDGLFHDARALDHLRQKHFPGAEQIAHHAHAGHERALDHVERALTFLPRFFRVGVDEIDDAFHERVRETFFHWRVSPCLLFNRSFLARFDALREINQAFRRVVSPVKEHIFHADFQLRLDLFVNGELAGVDDRHVESGLDGVK